MMNEVNCSTKPCTSTGEGVEGVKDDGSWVLDGMIMIGRGEEEKLDKAKNEERRKMLMISEDLFKPK